MGLKAFYISYSIVVSVSFARFGGDLALIGEIIAVSSLVIIILLYLDSRRRMNQIQNMVPSIDDVVRVDEDGTIHMDQRLHAIVTGIGQTMMQSFKMSALQGLSVDAKLEKGLKGAIAQDIIEEKFPLLDAGAGILGDFTGFNVKKYITKNPEALMQLIGMAQKNGINLGGLMGNNGTQRAGQSSGGRM